MLFLLHGRRLPSDDFTVLPLNETIAFSAKLLDAVDDNLAQTESFNSSFPRRWFTHCHSKNLGRVLLGLNHNFQQLPEHINGSRPSLVLRIRSANPVAGSRVRRRTILLLLGGNARIGGCSSNNQRRRRGIVVARPAGFSKAPSGTAYSRCRSYG